MNKQEAVELILKELERAEKLHPDFPRDVIHAAAIVGEEAGELLQAANDTRLAGEFAKSLIIKKMETEAAHTGAMAIRFLINL